MLTEDEIERFEVTRYIDAEEAMELVRDWRTLQAQVATLTAELLQSSAAVTKWSQECNRLHAELVSDRKSITTALNYVRYSEYMPGSRIDMAIRELQNAMSAWKE